MANPQPTKEQILRQGMESLAADLGREVEWLGERKIMTAEMGREVAQAYLRWAEKIDG